MKEIEEQGRKIAQQLGNDIVYNGPQYLNDEFMFHVFTDVAVTGTTFAAKTFEEAKANLIEKRKLFGAKPPSFSAKGDNPRRAITIGTCYEDAWRAIIRFEEGELVHGSVESKGKRIGHAWVELPTGFVWEPETGDFIRTSIFRDVFKPVEDARYSDLEAAKLAARIGNFGPWTQEERGKILKGGNPMKPRTETERLSFHERIFGKGSTPPAERLGRGQAVNDFMPMPPESGPPLPRMLKIRWPWKK